MHALSSIDWRAPRARIVGTVSANNGCSSLSRLDGRRRAISGRVVQRCAGLRVQLLFAVLVVVQTICRLIQTRCNRRPEHGWKGRWVVHAFEIASVP